METRSLDSARGKWKRRATATERGESPPPERTAPPPERASSAPQRAEKDQGPDPEAIRPQVRRFLAVADASVRQALELPQREGVDVELSDAASLDVAAEMVTPLVVKHGGLASPELRAVGGVGLLVAELLKDGGGEKIAERFSAWTGEPEPATTSEDVPEKTPDF